MTEPRPSDFLDDPLDPVAVRILGALVEKEFTTPDNYPLSLNALTGACNQATNREPVMSLAEEEVAAALSTLAHRSLVREVHRSDARVKRYRHLLADTLHLHPAELAALGVLLLRGPQTAGEIKGRTGRMVEIVDASHVELTLEALAAVAVPLAVQLPRQPGQKEARWAHLLGGEPPTGADGTAAAGEPVTAPRPPSRVDLLEEEVRTLRAEVEALRGAFQAFREEFR
ncbi:MAG: YceH family protein [Gemmatimonadota bacterium]